MSAVTPSFGILDYCIFGAVLVISLGIGIYTSLRANSSSQDFLMGGRSFGTLPIAMSLQVSFISAISLVGFTGETYAFGLQLILFLIGGVLGIAFAAVFVLPVLHPLYLTSINEYVGLRFECNALRKTITVITCVQGFIYLGSCLYAPTIALTTVTRLNYLFYIIILGLVVTLYASIGGLRAVVWTDVFQLGVMLVGLVAIIVVGIFEAGGIEVVWREALQGGRLDVLNTNPSLYERHNVYNTICFGFFFYSSLYGIAQLNVQRLCAVGTTKDALRVLWINAVGLVLIYLVIFGCGIVAYAVYAGCDPLKRGLIQRKEEIMPFFMIDKLSYIVGLPGLFVATLTGGTLSSLSSVLNAVVAMLWKDCMAELKFFASMEPKATGRVNKILSFLIGLVMIGFAILTRQAANLIQFSLTITSAIFGPIFGVFLLGMFNPRVNAKGAWVGLTVSSIIMSWITIGSFLYSSPPTPLPFSDDRCPALNDTSVISNATDKATYDIVFEEDPPASVETQTTNDFRLMALYDISYTLYTAMGVAICVLVGLVTSCATGNNAPGAVSPKYIAPPIRRFFWTEEELNFETQKESPNGHAHGIELQNLSKNEFG